MSPTYAATRRFYREFGKLSRRRRREFLVARDELIAGLRENPPTIRGGLVKSVSGADGVFELRFAADGRATFRYGEEIREGEAHIVWLRVGTHAVLDQPQE